jgi:hypothetical protein
MCIQPDAFDDVIKNGDFDGVAHAASPVVAAGSTPDGESAIEATGSFGLIEENSLDYIRPAVDGTVGILASIKRNG